jgi:hypothetical protein
MSDASVYEKARHFFTVSEIAKSFNVTEDTVLAHHGEAFRLGKAEHLQKPRILLNKMMDDLANIDLSDPKSVQQGVLLAKLIEMQWKKNEGYGQQINIVQAVEKPSIAEVKFVPFKADDAA